jgi:hypothetical protein
MEINQSILSRAVYGENGRVALPLNMFMQKSKDAHGGGKKHIEHLGVPLVVALVEINMNNKCRHNEPAYSPNSYASHPTLLHNRDSAQGSEITAFSKPIKIAEYKSTPTAFQPISNEMYDSLLQSVLENPIEEIPDSYPVFSKKYTRKNKLQRIKDDDQ